MEHEVVDDQLPAPFEDVDQADGASRAFEDVVLLDLHHRQLPAPAIEGVAAPCQVLLGGQQLDAGGQPFIVLGNLRKAHRFLLRGGHVCTTTRTDENHRATTVLD
jgi:hypothetical protein